MAFHHKSVAGIVRANIQVATDGDDVVITVTGNHIDLTNLSPSPLLYSPSGAEDSWVRVPGQKSASKGEPVRIYTGAATSIYIRGIYAPYGEGRPTPTETGNLPGRRHSFTLTDLGL